MAVEIAPERDFRSPGCDERCHVVRALVPGTFGRSELLLHDGEAHEDYGRRLAALEPGRTATVLTTGPLTIDIGQWMVMRDGERVELTPTELRLLMTLARRPGLLVRYADVVTAVWGTGFLAVGRSSWLHTVRVNVARLRSRLGTAGQLVVSVHTEGLQLRVIAPGAPLPLRRWARCWDRCGACGRTDRPHKGRSYCTRCSSRARKARTR